MGEETRNAKRETGKCEMRNVEGGNVERGAMDELEVGGDAGGDW